MATANDNYLQRLTFRAPEQTYKADQSSYWGGRKNGWDAHCPIFSTRCEETTRGGEKSNACFEYDVNTGTIRVVGDDALILKIEVFWKGRAPWGYHGIGIQKKLHWNGEGQPTEGNGKCNLPSDECAKLHKVAAADNIFLEVQGSKGCPVNCFWQCDGHISLIIRVTKGDTFNIINRPAHIQGTPWTFQLRVHAFHYIPSPSDISESPHNHLSHSGTDSLLEAVRSGSLDTVRHLIERGGSFTARYQTGTDGTTPKDVISENLQTTDPATYYGLKDLLCVNGRSHDCDHSNRCITSSSSTPPDNCNISGTGVVVDALCWSCRTPITSVAAAHEADFAARIKAEDDAFFGAEVDTDVDVDASKRRIDLSAAASMERGVCVHWLVYFTEAHG